VFTRCLIIFLNLLINEAGNKPESSGGSRIKTTEKLIAIFVSPVVYRFNQHIFMSQGHAKKHVGKQSVILRRKIG
jgi:hypothetical protein